MSDKMTPHKAKAIIRQKLRMLNLPPYYLTARTVSFSDLARGNKVWVAIHNWKPNPKWDDLNDIAHENGFRLETKGINL